MKILLFLFLFAFILFKSPGQSIDEMISKYTEANGKEYLKPLADCVGANFNSGFIHSARIRKTGFQMYLGLVTTTVFVPDKRKTFVATPEGFFEPKNPVEVPTLFGPAQNLVVNGENGTQYVFPGGMNLEMLPQAVPQLTIGSLFGTDFTLRYYSFNVSEDVGKLKLFGWGVRHSIDQYIPSCPVNLALGLYNQYFDVGDYIAANNWVFNVQTSVEASIFTFYSTLGYETAMFDIEYTYNDNGEDVTQAFDLKGANTVRFTAGLTFNLGPVKLNADYSFANQSVLTVGLGVGFGQKEKEKANEKESENTPK